MTDELFKWIATALGGIFVTALSSGIVMLWADMRRNRKEIREDVEKRLRVLEKESVTITEFNSTVNAFRDELQGEIRRVYDKLDAHAKDVKDLEDHFDEKVLIILNAIGKKND